MYREYGDVDHSRKDKDFRSTADYKEEKSTKWEGSESVLMI
jgi:hypothetical protein